MTSDALLEAMGYLAGLVAEKLPRGMYCTIGVAEQAEKLLVYVDKNAKLSVDAIPSEVDGFPVEVIRIGKIRPAA